MPKIQPAPLARPLSEIGREIQADYRAQGKPVYFAAVPYVQAMTRLGSLNDAYYEDSADTVVRYALENLTYWRGETAKRVKDELKAALADYDLRRNAARKAVR